jgi:drug/metabolite transporter (DMT)-like permease
MVVPKFNLIGYMLLLLLAAAIWGFAFVAQRVGMEFVGPFTFNGVRFALGSLSLIPLIFYFKLKDPKRKEEDVPTKSIMWAGVSSGFILFIAATFQQIGIIYTTAGKAAFITGLYVVFVPIISIFLKHKTTLNVWFGAILSAIGLYFLCVVDYFTIFAGDFLVLISSLFFAIHILVIGHFSKKVDVLKLSFIQFSICSLLNILFSIFIEVTTFQALYKVIIPILYAGFLSVGVAYTLQVVGQKKVPSSSAAIILSMETVFGALGGWLFLNEQLTFQGITGCILMFAGMIISQFNLKKLL